MRSSALEKLLLGLIYFVIFFALGSIHDISSVLAPHLTLHQLIHAGFMGDPGSFATAAEDIFLYGWVQPEHNWITNLWPPGFMLLEAGIAKLFGSEAPILLILQILASASFAFVSVLLSVFLRPWMKKQSTYVLPLLLFLVPMSRVFLFQDIGLSLGETFAISCFLAGLIFSFRSIEKKSLLNAVYAGFFIALSTYFRSQFEIFLQALMVGGLGVILWVFLKESRSRAKFYFQSIFITLLVAQCLDLPWRIFHWIRDRSIAWVATSSITFGNSVQTTEHFIKAGAGFVPEGGGNLVCRIDPSTCGNLEDARHLFIRTFLKHPFEWYSIKSKIVGAYWFASPQNWTSITAPPGFFDFFFNGLFLIMVVGSGVFLFIPKIRKHQLWPFLVWFIGSLYAAYILIFTVQQFEVRYFYFLKIFSFYVFSIQAAIYCHLVKNDQESGI